MDQIPYYPPTAAPYPTGLGMMMHAEWVLESFPVGSTAYIAAGHLLCSVLCWRQQRDMDGENHPLTAWWLACVRHDAAALSRLPDLAGCLCD